MLGVFSADKYLNLENLQKSSWQTRSRKGDFISSCTMHEMEDLVKGCGFYRSHRSYLINLDETINYEGMNIIMSDGTKAYLSKDKQSEFKEKLLARKFEMANG